MITDAWFRLDEILPMAERALKCPTHQTLTDIANGPALAWTATDRGDTLTPIGVAHRCDEHVQDDTATAWTWRHLPTGRHGTARPANQPTGYLPLTAEPGTTSLIGRLRAAHQARQHWMAIPAHPDHGVTTAAVRLLDHRADVAPADATWSPAVVTAAAVGGGWYPALIADDYRISCRDRDDDVIALFDRATVDHIVTDLIAQNADTDPRTDPMPGEFAVAGFDEGALVLWWEHDDGQHTHLVEVDRVYPDSDGLFAVGAYLWPWSTNAN